MISSNIMTPPTATTALYCILVALATLVTPSTSAAAATAAVIKRAEFKLFGGKHTDGADRWDVLKSAIPLVNIQSGIKGVIETEISPSNAQQVSILTTLIQDNPDSPKYLGIDPQCQFYMQPRASGQTYELTPAPNNCLKVSGTYKLELLVSDPEIDTAVSHTIGSVKLEMPPAAASNLVSVDSPRNETVYTLKGFESRFPRSRVVHEFQDPLLYASPILSVFFTGFVLSLGGLFVYLSLYRYKFNLGYLGMGSGGYGVEFVFFMLIVCLSVVATFMYFFVFNLIQTVLILLFLSVPALYFGKMTLVGQQELREKKVAHTKKHE